MSSRRLDEEIQGRFMRMNPENGQYYLLTKNEARKKVNQALRDKQDDPQDM